MVAHTGSVAVRLLADRVGLTSQSSQALARRSTTPRHDRGGVLADVTVMIADGGEAIADIDVLRHQKDVLGRVASPATVWRMLDELTPGRLRKIATARARVRRHVWAQFPGGIPASRVAGSILDSGVVVLDVDATIVVAHSEKEQAAPTFKHTSFQQHLSAPQIRCRLPLQQSHPRHLQGCPCDSLRGSVDGPERDGGCERRVRVRLEAEPSTVAERSHAGESLMARIVSIELTDDEALVLFDLVARLGERHDLEFEDQAEARVLWDLEAELERKSEAVVADDYRQRLIDARGRVRDTE